MSGRRAVSRMARLAAGPGRGDPPAGMTPLHPTMTQVARAQPVEPGAAVLTASGVRKSYASPTGPLEVLRGVDLVVERGTILAILGASGAGKSTLLNVLGTLDRADAGTLEVRGARLDA